MKTDWTCIICEKQINNWDECKETWYEGSRVSLCKDKECIGKHIVFRQTQFKDKHKKGV